MEKARKMCSSDFKPCLAVKYVLSMRNLLSFPHHVFILRELCKWGMVYLVSSSSLRTRISSSLISWGGSCCRDWEQTHRMAQHCSLKTTHSYQTAKNIVSMPTSPPSFYFPHTIATINDSSTFISSLKVKWAHNVVKVWLKSLSRTDMLLPGHLDLWYQPMEHTPHQDKIWEL